MLAATAHEHQQVCRHSAQKVGCFRHLLCVHSVGGEQPVHTCAYFHYHALSSQRTRRDEWGSDGIGLASFGVDDHLYMRAQVHGPSACMSAGCSRELGSFTLKPHASC